jgi:DNA-binding transcriptional LysR family regulator
MRNGRIRPTETGVAFITLARFLLETRDEVIEALIAIERGQIHTTRFGCCPLVDQDLFRGFCAMHKEILPTCFVRPTHGDTLQLAEEVAAGAVDAAIVTLPVNHPELHVEEIRRDRLVACLRRDNPLARKAALKAKDLQNNLIVMYHPQRHPEAHERLLERLDNAGVKVEEYSRASNPSEMQTLIKEGYGFAVVREGSIIDAELTTRPISDVDWTMDTAIIYHKQRHPKTVPVLVRNFKRQFNFGVKENRSAGSPGSAKRPTPTPITNSPVQLDLLGEAGEMPRDTSA